MKKRINYILFTFFAIFIAMGTTRAAASVSVSTSKTSTVVGNTVTVTVKYYSSNLLAQAYGTLTYDANVLQLTSGNPAIAYSVGDTPATTKSYTYTFRAKGSGTSKITVSNPQIYELNSTSTSAVAPGANSVYVKVITQQELEASYSKNNYLSSLSVDGTTLTPEFNKDTLEYSVTLEPNTTSIKINAAKEDSKASIEGAGDVTVTEGENKINIVVTAENGNQRTYVINATVKELSPIEITLNDQKYNVVRKKEALTKPETFNDATVTINGEEVPAFKSDITGYTLVGLKDSSGTIKLYIYNETDNTFSLYNEVTTNKLTINILSINKKELPSSFIKTTVNINGVDIDCYQYKKGSEFVVLYGMNVDTGKEDYYLYDEKDKTIQRFNLEEANYNKKTITNYLYVIIAVSSLSVILLVSLIIVIINFRKNMKKINKLPIKKALEDELGKTKIMNFDLTKDIDKKDDKQK